MRLTLSALALATVALAPVSAADTVLRFAHVLTEDQPAAQAARQFATKVEEETGGEVRVQVLPAGQLGSDVEIVEQIQLGTAHIGIPPTAKLGNFEPRMQVFDLPFLAPTEEGLYAILDGEIGQELLESLEDDGLKGLCYWGAGLKQITSDRPIRSPEDLHGVKMRTMDSQAIIEQYRVWGASPIPIAFAEVYNALQQGVAEAQENSLTTIDRMKFYEVQDHLTLSNHAYLPYAVIVSKAAWDRLGPEHQEVLEEACVEGRKLVRAELRRLDEELVDELSAHLEIHQLSPEAREAFFELSQEVHARFADVVTQELLDRIYEVAEGR